MAGDIIRLEGMVFYGYHGVTAAEREVGQRFIVDVEVKTNLTAAGDSDSLQDTVDYTRLFHIVKRVIEGPGRNLLESLAQAIAQEILQFFPVNAVAVKITKPHVPIKGSILTGASVEIRRQREGLK